MTAPTTSPRGRCGACGRECAVTSRGLVWAHDSRQTRDYLWGRCLGAGLPPIDAAAPLLTTELADLRRQLADLQRENAGLRRAIQAERHMSEALRLRIKAADSWRKVAAVLLDAKEADWLAEQERWRARHAEIDATYARVIEQ